MGNGAITVQEKMALEVVRKIALAIIMGKQHITLSETIIDLGLETLATRRKNRCLKFALKALKGP